MADTALRKLDRNLPRIDMRSPALIARQAKKPQVEVDLSRRMTAREKRDADAAMRAAMLAVARAKELAEATTAQAAAILGEAETRAAEIIAAAKAEAAEVLKQSGVPVRDTIREVAGRHGIDPALIVGPFRNKRIVAIRHEAIALAHLRRPDLSLQQLGRAFDRDHTSILHALRKTEAYLGRKATYGEGGTP